MSSSVNLLANISSKFETASEVSVILELPRGVGSQLTTWDCTGLKMKMGGTSKFVGGYAVRMDEMLQEDWNKKSIKEQNPEEHPQWEVKKGRENAQR